MKTQVCQAQMRAIIEEVDSPSYHCTVRGGDSRVIAEAWILNTAWEVLALCLAIWIAVKDFLELHKSSTEWWIGDCITMLIKTHVLYFAG
jgi:hypothetical protein